MSVCPPVCLSVCVSVRLRVRTRSGVQLCPAPALPCDFHVGGDVRPEI